MCWVTSRAISARLYNVAWSEPVTRPYGGYLMAASNGRQHVKQADVALKQVAANTLTGSATCLNTEFRPRAQEAVVGRDKIFLVCLICLIPCLSAASDVC